MENKQIIIDGIDIAKCRYFTSEWDFNNCGHICKETECKYKRLWYKKQLKHKEQECEELKKYLHKNFEEKDKLHLIIDRLLEASGYDTNTASAEDFEDVYKNMRYEKQQLDQLKAENEELRRSITKIFACLIKANRTNKIVNTIWVDRITTLWDYIALTLGIEGDQTQIEEQILQKIS